MGIQLDHTVINVKFSMDKAQSIFTDLGFTLTARGYHTLGSITHGMMFGTDYLELIGFPEDVDRDTIRRPEIANAPYGINGLVFKTDNVDKIYQHLKSLGLEGAEPKSFSRPVHLPEGTKDASFTTTNVRWDVFSGGRIYFCTHHTPELLWRSEWQSHANGVTAMPEFVMVSQNYKKEAETLSQILQTDLNRHEGSMSIDIDGCRLIVMSPSVYNDRYGSVASPMGRRTSIFGALVFKVDDLVKIRELIEGQQNLIVQDNGTRISLRETNFDAVLEFSQTH